MNRHLGSLAFVALATGVSLGCYLVSAHVGAERLAVANLRGSIVRDTQAMRGLDAELRTRARLPQLQQWNDRTLVLVAPAPAQMLGQATQLAAWLPQTEAAPARVQAVARDVPEPPRPAMIAAQIDTAPPAPATLERDSAKRRVREGAERSAPIDAPAHAAPTSAILAARLPVPAPTPDVADLTQAIGRELQQAENPVRRASFR